MKNPNRLLSPILITIAAFLSASPIQAQTINLQVLADPVYTSMQPTVYSGTGASQDTGTYFNALSIGESNVYTGGTVFSANDLTESDGVTASTVSFSLGGSATDGSDEGFQPLDYDPYEANFAPDLFSQVAYVGNSQVATFTIGGLTAGAQYDLYLYAQNSGYGDPADTNENTAITPFTIDGVTKIATNVPSDENGFVLNGNYVLFNSLTADSNGDITGTYNAEFGKAYFNGFTLVSDGSLADIPEPSSLSLAAVSLLGLALLGFRGRFRNLI